MLNQYMLIVEINVKKKNQHCVCWWLVDDVDHKSTKITKTDSKHWDLKQWRVYKHLICWITFTRCFLRWPKTLAGFMAFLPCAVTSVSSTPQEKRAWRRCDRTGRWAEHDYNQCSYASQFTRSLHELTQVCKLHHHHHYHQQHVEFYWSLRRLGTKWCCWRAVILLKSLLARYTWLYWADVQLDLDLLNHLCVKAREHPQLRDSLRFDWLRPSF